jgi:chorismate mutase
MPDDPQLLALRAQIDAVNLRLRDALQERARLVRQVAARKRALGAPMVDVEREQAMLDSLLAGAGEGFAPDELARVLRGLFRAYRRLCVQTGHDA